MTATSEDLVFTLLGPDRPGIVKEISALVREHGGNWLESSLSHLAGHFAGLVRVTVSAEHRAALLGALSGLEASGLKVVVADQAGTMLDEGTRVAFELTANDRPGLIEELTGALTQLEVNVIELHTTAESAPMATEMLFVAQFDVALPGNVDEEALSARLEQLSDDIMIDIIEFEHDDEPVGA
ncbi:MAG: ACT domain-containing protein [Myxococcota bacterium]|nr:ACT domain-containing protein [Myxococcota bacterium]